MGQRLSDIPGLFGYLLHLSIVGGRVCDKHDLYRQYIQILFVLGNIVVPERFKAIVDRFGDDPVSMRQAGIIYASEQIIDLIANGITHIHVYSMNKPDVASDILYNLKGIIN